MEGAVVLVDATPPWREGKTTPCCIRHFLYARLLAAITAFGFTEVVEVTADVVAEEPQLVPTTTKAAINTSTHILFIFLFFPFVI